MDHLRLLESWNPRPCVWVGRDCCDSSSLWICLNCLGSLPQEGHWQPREDPELVSYWVLTPRDDPEKRSKIRCWWLQVQHPWQCSKTLQQTQCTIPTSTTQTPAAPPHVLLQGHGSWGAGAGYSSKPVPNSSKTRSLNTYKKHPQTTAQATQMTATQGTTTDALTSSVVTQSNRKAHSLSKRRSHSSGAVWESRWSSWAVRPNEPSGFRGRKAVLNHASALVSACP